MAERILEVAERHSRLAASASTSHASVHPTIQEQQLYPCHIQSVQELVPHDTPARRAFCQCILQQSAEDLTFTAKVTGLLTDESYFTRAGTTDTRKEHVWSEENPHAIRYHRQQRQISIKL
jgi:hypothetical protein